MNVVVANMYYFSLYYRENTGCLQCKAEGYVHGLQRGPFTKRKGRFFYTRNKATNCQNKEAKKEKPP